MLLAWYLVLLACFLLTWQKWWEFFKFLRQAVALIILDAGFVVLAQLSLPLVTMLTFQQTMSSSNYYFILACLALYHILNYLTILNRLYSIRIANRLAVKQCYWFGLQRLVHFLVLLVLVFILLAILTGILRCFTHALFNNMQLGFMVTVFAVCGAVLLFGIFSWLTYFTFILVVVERQSVLQALLLNFKLMRKLPVTLVVQITVFTILLGPLVGIDNLYATCGVYLWLLLGTSLSVAIYCEQIQSGTY